MMQNKKKNWERRKYNLIIVRNLGWFSFVNIVGELGPLFLHDGFF